MESSAETVIDSSLLEHLLKGVDNFVRVGHIDIVASSRIDSSAKFIDLLFHVKLTRWLIRRGEKWLAPVLFSL